MPETRLSEIVKSHNFFQFTLFTICINGYKYSFYILSILQLPVFKNNMYTLLSLGNSVNRALVSREREFAASRSRHRLCTVIRAELEVFWNASNTNISRHVVIVSEFIFICLFLSYHVLSICLPQ